MTPVPDNQQQPGSGADAPAPGWASIADGAALALLALALFVSLAGRALVLGIGRYTLPPAPMLVFAAAAIVLVRHVAKPRPDARATFRRWAETVRSRPHLAAATRAFAVTRPLVFVVAYFAVVTFGFSKAPGFTLSTDPLANLPARFDAGWYGGIALDGYEWDRQLGRQRNIAFFPALPMLMRPVGAALGMNDRTLPREKRLLRALWAGVLVSLAAFAWGLYYVAKLADLAGGREAAASAPLLLAAYPFAVFFSAPYSESLFLLGAAGAFYHFHREQWVKACLFGLLTGFSRPNGALVSIPLGLLALAPAIAAMRAAHGTGTWRALGVRLLAAAMPGVAMLIFSAYLYRLTGIWLVWARMHEAWGRRWGTGPMAQGWEWLTTEGLTAVLQGVPYDTINTLAVLFATVLVWPVFRRLGVAYGIFVLVNILPPIFAGGALSMGRVTSTLFPIFIALSLLLPARSVPGWTAGMGLLQGFVAAIFFTWRELF